jgi:hypothetical protein
MAYQTVRKMLKPTEDSLAAWRHIGRIEMSEGNAVWTTIDGRSRWQ